MKLNLIILFDLIFFQIICIPCPGDDTEIEGKICEPPSEENMRPKGDFKVTVAAAEGLKIKKGEKTSQITFIMILDITKGVLKKGSVFLINLILGGGRRNRNRIRIRNIAGDPVQAECTQITEETNPNDAFGQSAEFDCVASVDNQEIDTNTQVSVDYNNFFFVDPPVNTNDTIVSPAAKESPDIPTTNLTLTKRKEDKEESEANKERYTIMTAGGDCNIKSGEISSISFKSTLEKEDDNKLKGNEITQQITSNGYDFQCTAKSEGTKEIVINCKPLTQIKIGDDPKIIGFEPIKLQNTDKYFVYCSVTEGQVICKKDPLPSGQGYYTAKSGSALSTGGIVAIVIVCVVIVLAIAFISVILKKKTTKPDVDFSNVVDSQAKIGENS